MRIKTLNEQVGNHLFVTLECNHCGHTVKTRGYDNANYYFKVLPGIVCESCDRSDIENIRPTQRGFDMTSNIYTIQASLDGGDVENLFGQDIDWRVSWYGQVWLVPIDLAQLPTETLMDSSDPTVLSADPLLAMTWVYSGEAKTLTDALQSGSITLNHGSLRVNGIEAAESSKAQDYLDEFTRNRVNIDWEIKKITPCILLR